MNMLMIEQYRVGKKHEAKSSGFFLNRFFNNFRVVIAAIFSNVSLVF